MKAAVHLLVHNLMVEGDEQKIKKSSMARM